MHLVAIYTDFKTERVVKLSQVGDGKDACELGAQLDDHGRCLHPIFMDCEAYCIIS